MLEYVEIGEATYAINYSNATVHIMSGNGFQIVPIESVDVDLVRQIREAAEKKTPPDGRG
jgi:hypothetical protein